MVSNLRSDARFSAVVLPFAGVDVLLLLLAPVLAEVVAFVVVVLLVLRDTAFASTACT